MQPQLTRVLALLILLWGVTSFSAFAQTGTIKGTIKDEKTQEAIIGASVGVEGTSIGGATDLDGTFTLAKVPAGTYTLVINYVSYQRKTIPNLTVEAGKVVVVNTALTESAAQLGEVVVTGTRVTNTEVAVITEVRNAQLVAVGVSSEQIVKSQDRDAAQIARRVPGVAIQDNRFVLVRGLTQRYNSVLLNDVIAPSTEVDTRAFSFDLIPSSIIDRMLIFKSGSAELPGEFSGGVIKVYTKRAPEENFTSLNISGGYRAGTTFEDVQRYEGGKIDFLGFDDGDRSIPNNFPARLSSDFTPQQRATLANQLPNRWAVNSETAAPDLRLTFNLGRRFNIGEKQAGTLTSINYANYNQNADIDLTFYESSFAGPDQVASQYKDQFFSNQVRLGAVQNFWLRLNSRNSLEFKNLYTQLGTSETVVREGQDITQTSTDVRSFSQRYESRGIYSGQLIGNHDLPNDKTEVKWVGGFSYTGREEPDWRRVRYTRPIGSTSSEGQPAEFRAAIPFEPNPIDAGRYFSDLDEYVGTAVIDVVHKLGAEDTTGRDAGAKLKFGAYAERKDRTFDARFFGYGGNGDISSITGLPIGQLFAPQNVTGELGTLSLREGTAPNDQYTANSTLLAGYASITLPVGPDFTGTVGFRGEYNDQVVESQLRGGTLVQGGDKVFSPLPSLNLTYNLTDKTLVRAAFSSTINRPEFRELAPFDFYDFNLNSNVIGNYTLQTARIQNADLRWEFYPASNEQITLGAFYKHFTDPIESFLILTSTGGLSNTFINSESAQNYGAELEVRKSFAELSSSPFIRRLSVVGNASYIFSRVDLGETVQAPDPSGAIDEVNVSESQDRRRPLQNQSPYLVNLGVYYANEDNGSQVSLLYNVAGPRIFAVGNIEDPTVYEVARNVLDLVVTKKVSKHFEIRAAYQDIFNQPFKLVQDTNRNAKVDSSDQDVRTFRRGSYGTLGLTYAF